MALKERLIEKVMNSNPKPIPKLSHIFCTNTYMEAGWKEARNNLLAGLREALKEIEGSYALAVISADEQGKLVLARKDSPLVIGLRKGKILLHLM